MDRQVVPCVLRDVHGDHPVRQREPAAVQHHRGVDQVHVGRPLREPEPHVPERRSRVVQRVADHRDPLGHARVAGQPDGRGGVGDREICVDEGALDREEGWVAGPGAVCGRAGRPPGREVGVVGLDVAEVQCREDCLADVGVEHVEHREQVTGCRAAGVCAADVPRRHGRRGRHEEQHEVGDLRQRQQPRLVVREHALQDAGLHRDHSRNSLGGLGPVVVEDDQLVRPVGPEAFPIVFRRRLPCRGASGVRLVNGGNRHHLRVRVDGGQPQTRRAVGTGYVDLDLLPHPGIGGPVDRDRGVDHDDLQVRGRPPPVRGVAGPHVQPPRPGVDPRGEPALGSSTGRVWVRVRGVVEHDRPVHRNRPGSRCERHGEGASG